MTWEYDPALLVSTSTGSVNTVLVMRSRFYSGDVDDTDQLAQDEEFRFALTEEDNDPRKAAASVLEHLAARYARTAGSKLVGGLMITYATRSQIFADRARMLRSQSVMSSGSVEPLPTGVSVSRRETVEDDADLVPSFFTREMLDDTGVSAEDDDE